MLRVSKNVLHSKTNKYGLHATPLLVSQPLHILLCITEIVINYNTIKIIKNDKHKFLNYAAFILSTDHPPHDYNPILNKTGLSSLVDRRKVAYLKFLCLLIHSCIDSPVLLSMINFKVLCSSYLYIFFSKMQHKLF